MIVRHFDIKPPETQPPHEDGWEQSWQGFYGYHTMAKCESQQAKAEWEERDRAERAKGQMNEGEFERDCFLTVLADIKREHVNMFELGAGWGRMCLTLAGVIDYGLTPLIPKSYRCLAVEGEPTHYQWAKEHFEIHNINGIVVHGAVSDKNGKCRFRVNRDPASCYGQNIDSQSFLEMPNRHMLRRLISKIKGSVTVPMYTADRLVQKYGFDHVDILQMDVQGAEDKVMLGAAESVKNDLIDYLLIGIHRRELNDVLRQMLSPKFDLIVDIYRESVGTMAGFPPISCHDGIQLYKRKNM
ncbi:FkbM family methyltransferase [Chloroflexota bacterium]